MKHYKFPAAYFIGWSRLCRSGSILGPQQQWLLEMQNKMFNDGDDYRIKKSIFIYPGWLKTADKSLINELSKADNDKSKTNVKCDNIE